MTTTAAEAPLLKKPRKPKAVPEYLIYEVLDGIPLYYAGYEQVLKNKKTLEDIMGYGSWQAFILGLLNRFFTTRLKESYWVLPGEIGLHLSARKNFSCDLVIYEARQLSIKQLENKYFSIPPKIVVEVDTKAHQPEFTIPNYYQRKTQHLLDFGVEQVVWVFTDPRKITSAKNEGPWLTVNWNENVEVMGHTLNLQSLVDQLK